MPRLQWGRAKRETMKMYYKKFVYLLNDITNVILNKENNLRIKKLTRIMALLNIALFISVVINVILLFVK